MVTMNAFVPPPSPRPPRFGLVAAVGGEGAIQQFVKANPSEDGLDERWQLGFDFQPWDCSSTTAAFDMTCGIEAAFAQTALPANIGIRPVGLYEMLKCSTFGNNLPVLQDRVMAKLLSTTSFKLEREFWKGTLGAGFGNQYLANNATVIKVEGGAAVPAVQALALLVEQASVCSQGNRLMIHCSPATAIMWRALNAIRNENGLLLDPLDNIVVAGAGYDGSSPTGTDDATNDTNWAYATEIVDVRLSPVKVSDLIDHVTKGTNVQFVLAQRAASVNYDGCCLFGVNVDICQTFCEPG
jgi:hypothetical protein